MDLFSKHLKSIILLVLAIFLIGIFWRFGTLLYFPAAGDFLEKRDTMKLHPKETLEQTFTAPRNNLAKIEIILRSPGIKPGDKASAQLLDASCQKTIREGFLADSFLSSSNLYEFSFPTISDSYGKNYCLHLTFLPQKDSAKSLQFFYRPQDGVSFKNISNGDTFSGESLSFRLVHKDTSFWKNLTELNQRISQYKPALLKGGFLAFYAVGFLLLSLFFIIVLILL